MNKPSKIGIAIVIIVSVLLFIISLPACGMAYGFAVRDYLWLSFPEQYPNSTYSTEAGNFHFHVDNYSTPVYTPVSADGGEVRYRDIVREYIFGEIIIDGKTYSFFASEAGNEGIIAFYSRELQEVKDSTADFYEIADDYFLFSVKVIKANKKRIVLQVDYVGAGQPFTQGAEYTLYRTPDSEEGAQ